MDDEHFSNITKLPKKRKKKTIDEIAVRKLQTVNSRVPAATCKLYKFYEITV
jgi:hypothetical protein